MVREVLVMPPYTCMIKREFFGLQFCDINKDLREVSFIEKKRVFQFTMQIVEEEKDGYFLNIYRMFEWRLLKKKNMAAVIS